MTTRIVAPAAQRILRDGVSTTSFVRLARTPDEAHLFATVGSLVDELYPNGREKLIAKLLANMAVGDHSFVVDLAGEPVAYAAETVKPGNRMKLSTIWVREDQRRRGFGRQLIESLVQRWLGLGVAEAFVTVRLGRDEELLALLSQYGFWHEATVPNRYGRGRDEVVLMWNPESWKSCIAGSAVPQVD